MDSMKDPYADLEINARAQLSILEVCRHYNPAIRVVFASTRQVYGKPHYLPVDEKHPLSPVDVNGVNKLAGEWYHILYNNVYGIQTTVLRLTNTYGPRMRVKDARQTFLGVWIYRLVDKQPFEVWDGQQLRDFTYVDDAVEALLLAATCPNATGQIYNLGGECSLTLKDLADMLIAVNQGGEYTVRTFPADRKVIDIGDYYSDFRLIREVMHWEPRIPLAEGLARTLDYYKQHIAHYVP
jgi:UDP-glucose 4-epimerase